MLVVLLFLYRCGRHLADGQVTRSFTHAAAVWDLERQVWLPDESLIQQWALNWRPNARLMNLYYVGAHFPGMGLTLVWLFLRHRPFYGRVRAELIILTAAGLVVHVAFPLAPPRLVTDLGMVDTMGAVGPSAYPAGEGFANQYAAMPSLHVGWAVLTAIAVIRAARTRARLLVVLHPILTSWWS